ncbi:homoserine kinase [Candidatus Poribacteria bacterium]|nr:homoserine kinase [Candidatus Poribacteria bacterium]
MKKVSVKIPASTTNLGSGFDVLGIALNLYNTVEVEFSKSGLCIEIQGEGADVLPRDEDNLVYKAIKSVFDSFDEKVPPLTIRLVNNIPLARGLGSSGTAAIGGVMAANALCDAGFSTDDILLNASSFDGHPDNVATSLLGGFVIAAKTEKQILCKKIIPPKPLKVVVVIPDFQLLTSAARSILPKTMSIETAIFNISRASMLVASMTTGDYSQLAIATEDKIHQPHRKALIPGMEEAFEAAKSVDENAPVALSGAGPSLVAFCINDADEVGKSMAEAFNKHKVKSHYLILDIDYQGAVVS